ncbi:hypothetical protein PoB_000805700 [Plakobranchus ocellatus]|uniref:Uncharacterized protein n=1 Tax=Plakobranchus ocellatus TaxID=259542 RepID=A0AAV3YGJ8_9GAST|nr:hypothetical protein PoB_000805700 [Plakobranchus ocellatus]
MSSHSTIDTRLETEQFICTAENLRQTRTQKGDERSELVNCSVFILNLVWTLESPDYTPCAGAVKGKVWLLYIASPQQGDLKLLGSPSGQGAGDGARTRDRRIPEYLRIDSLTTVPPTPRDREMRYELY